MSKVKRTDKSWAVVRTRSDGSLVAFEDLFDMVQVIIQCEVEKYEKNGRDAREAWLLWGTMVQECLLLCTQFEADWDPIADRFGLPRRDGSRVPGPVLVLPQTRDSRSWPSSKGQNPDGTWGELGWFTEAMYREWG